MKILLLSVLCLICSTIANGQGRGGQGGSSSNMGSGKSFWGSNPTAQYALAHSTSLPLPLQKLVNESVSSSRGGMTGAPEVVSMNMLLIRAIRGRKALDVGLFGGVSAVASALAVTGDGSVVGMDVSDSSWNQIGKRYAQEAGVLNKIDVRIKPARETMDELIRNGQTGTYDFCFIDADKESYDTYYEQCLTLLRSGGIITIDNVLWGGRVLSAQPGDTTSSTGVLNNLNKKIAADTRVWANLLPIGDGLMVVLKK